MGKYSIILNLSHYRVGNIRDALGDCEPTNCRSRIRAKLCENGCCKNGAILLPGEEKVLLYEQKKGKILGEIMITRGKIENCLGENGCLIKLPKRPILCQLYPLFIVVLNPKLKKWQILDYPDKSCPALKECGGNFKNRVARVRPLLQKFLFDPKKSQEIATAYFP